ncbi:hypothetical protein LOTGIDRAFT_162903 [Lottia gigantea]|uniref:G-protein coupled receptors family 1 profile domain-containing protein n=1 Tax=Lottia gigantea TaxID=225164 RepID=V3ZLM3_LOTGI|nr:hypothetical protein LOTGIDRAFT_162903 [Lottia gigantea]ESO92248.1 hypothetical protein LOTGIDRAFT_162903 [Lottia gigantea]
MASDNTTEYWTNSTELKTPFVLIPDIPQLVRILVVTSVTVFIITSNIINILVLRRTRMSANAKLCLSNLGYADLEVGLVSCSPCVVVAILGYWPFGEIFCQIAGFAHGVSVVVSILSLALVSVDRYIAIVKALHYQTVFTKTRCKIILFSFWIISMISFIIPNFLVPDFLYYKFNTIEGICGLYWGFPLFCILTSVFPISSGIVVACSTFCIVRYLRKSDTSLSSSVGARVRGRGSRDTKALKILMATTCLYFICWGPYVISVSITSYLPSIKAPPIADFTFMWVANSNSFINVLVYSVVYKSFRDEIKRMFTPKYWRKERSLRPPPVVSYIVSSDVVDSSFQTKEFAHNVIQCE